MKKSAFILFGLFVLVGGLLYANGSQETGASSANGSASKASLVVWIPGNDKPERDAFLGLVSGFEKAHANVNIQLQQIPWNDYFTKLNAAFAGGSAPDVYGLGYGQAGPVYSNGQLLALNSYLKGWSGWTDIHKNILAAGEDKGNLYLIMMPDIKVFWYRTDKFKQAGLDPSHAPKTIQAIQQDAAKLTVKDGGKTKFAGIDVSTSNGEQTLAEYMLMYKDIGLWDSNLKPLWDSPTSLKALNLLNGFVQRKESFFATENQVAGSPFRNGLAAMYVQHFYGQKIYASKLGKDNIAFGVQPGGRSQSGATFLGVYSNTHYKQDAVDLLKYFTSDIGQKAIFNSIGFIPTRESLKQWFVSQDPSYNAAWIAMENARTYGPMNKYFFNMLKVLRPALESVYYGKDTASNAMAKSAKAYVGMMK